MVQPSELLRAMEQEALLDLQVIDVPPEHEAALDIGNVQQWYFETEKLIRVLANTLPSTMSQPINQLRYAGHHILKATAVLDDAEVKKANLIEAFKHCKRAYYDALDLYIYHMAESHRDKLAFLPDKEQSRELAEKLSLFLNEINQARLDSLKRIEYYANVQQKLLGGLKLVSQINEALAASGINSEILQNRKILAKQNLELKAQLKQRLATGEKKFNNWMLGITLAIVLSTFLGLVFQNFGTQLLLQSHHFLHIQPAQSLQPKQQAVEKPEQPPVQTEQEKTE
ncbi:MAG: hypothetical protein IBX52_13160 [Bacterioplanes sp.]|nr:hypothetical protein [Bacterioplanes sp.]